MCLANGYFQAFARVPDARFGGMPVSSALRRFCLAHPNAFVIPAEAMDEHGLNKEMATMLVEEDRLTADRVVNLEAGTALYWQRCRDLFARAPGSWFPPRQSNILVVSEPRGVVPYMEPFIGTSAMLYTSDLDTNPEYVAYLLVHIERLALLRSVRSTLVCNLSYWFDRDAESRRAFARAAAKARRPDARCFAALARAFDWVDQLVHLPLREPPQDLTEQYLAIEGADLYVPRRLEPQVAALCDSGEQAVMKAMQKSVPASVPAHSRTVDALCDWLQQTRAHVIVHATDGSTAWSPEMNDPRWIRRALHDASDDAVASVHTHLRLIDERSRQFLDCVRDPAALPKQCAVLEAGDGAYVDPARGAVVYELKQPGFDALSVAAPPYFELLLGARVMHEWGHVAHTAKFLRVPAENKAAYTEARAGLGECFTRTLEAMPERVFDRVAEEASGLAHCADELPSMLARKTLSRVGDYLSNLMCSKLIPGEEMQAYVRTNVRHHLDENLGLISELARYAYEVHYLELAGLPRSYFFGTTRFNEYFIESGIISEEGTHALFDAVGRVLACYAIDQTKLALPVH